MDRSGKRRKEKEHRLLHGAQSYARTQKNRYSIAVIIVVIDVIDIIVSSGGQF